MSIVFKKPHEIRSTKERQCVKAEIRRSLTQARLEIPARSPDTTRQNLGSPSCTSHAGSCLPRFLRRAPRLLWQEPGPISKAGIFFGEHKDSKQIKTWTSAHTQPIPPQPKTSDDLPKPTDRTTTSSTQFRVLPSRPAPPCRHHTGPRNPPYSNARFFPHDWSFSPSKSPVPPKLPNRATSITNRPKT